jgi:endo-1,4-beta-xylanase
MPTLTRRAFLKSSALAAAGVLAGGCAAGQTQVPVNEWSALPSLRAVAESKGVWFGAAVSSPLLVRDRDCAAAVARECNLIVPEYEAKMQHIAPRPGAWNFGGADALWRWSQQNGMKMRGHTLIWHAGLPGWIKDMMEGGGAEEWMERYIHTVAGRYQGRFLSWDVVNEAVDTKDGHPEGLRSSPWLAAMGPSYIEKAFRFAAEADPSARLVYNDYMVETSAQGREAVLGLLRRLKDRGVPVHGCGLQSHIWNGKWSNLSAIKAFCREITRMEIDILITEFDVLDLQYLAADAAERDRRIAGSARIYLEAILSECRPKEILSWGLSDRHTWLRNDKKLNPRGIPVRPLPLDGDLRRKPVWLEISRALQSL